MTSNTSGLSNDSGHGLNLSLSTAESSKLLLGELTGTLLLGVTDQLNNSSLVRSETSNFLDNVTNEGSSGRGSTLSGGDTGSLLSGGDLVALVDANGNSYKVRLVAIYNEITR